MPPSAAAQSCLLHRKLALTKLPFALGGKNGSLPPMVEKFFRQTVQQQQPPSPPVVTAIRRTVFNQHRSPPELALPPPRLEVAKLTQVVSQPSPVFKDVDLQADATMTSLMATERELGIASEGRGEAERTVHFEDSP